MIKKYIILTALSILMQIYSNAQSVVEWSPPMPVSVTSGNFSPVIALLDDGSPAAVWGKVSTIYFSRMVDGAFVNPIAMATPGVSPSIYTFGGLDMAIHGSTIFISFESFSDGLFLIRSNDGGETFESAVNVYNPPPGKWTTLSALTVDEDGNPLVSAIFENTNETEASIILVRSLDGGASFEPPVTASDPARGDFVCECCTPDIYAHGNDVWLIFRNNDNNLRDIWVSRSSDGGASFTQAVDVDATDWVINACPITGPEISALGGDSLITSWSSSGTGSNNIYYSTLNRQTMQKGSEVHIPHTNMNSLQSHPKVAGANDTVGIVWSENGFGADGTDLMFTFSTSGSDGLLASVNNITETTGAQQFPALLYNQGLFHLINTDGSIGLEYRIGVVTNQTAVQEVVANHSCFKLIDHPSGDGVIKLSRTCDDISVRQATLYNLIGELIKREKLNSESRDIALDTKQIPSGVYLLLLDTTDGQELLKVVIGE